jgi:predicted TIM-barrel fold metal-dependent hydrolase
MTKNDGIVVDVDAHYYESPRDWARYLDEPWRSRIAAWSSEFYAPVEAVGLSADPHVQGRIAHKLFPQTKKPEDIPEVMKFLGLDCIVLLPNSMLSINHISNRGRALSLCQGYIEHMLEKVVNPATGIFTTLCVSPHDPRKAAAMIERYSKYPGVCSICLMTDGPLPFPYGDAYHDPIYSAAIDCGLPILMHSGFGGADGDSSGLGLQSYAENHVAFVINHEIQLTSVVMQGVRERFPNLRLIWEEAGVFWIPGLMFRLDTEYARRRSDHTILRKPPSEYIKDYYFGTQPLDEVSDKKYLRYLFEMIDGERTLMYASDWPHQDFDHPRVIRNLPFLSEEGKQKILGGNALGVLRFEGFEPSAVEPAAGSEGRA